MAKRITIKDLNYTAYELGIAQGRKAIMKGLGIKQSDDPLDYLEARWPDRSLDEFEDMVMDDGTVEEVEEIAKNLMDGIEDGVRSAMARWLSAYKQSLR